METEEEQKFQVISTSSLVSIRSRITIGLLKLLENFNYKYINYLPIHFTVSEDDMRY